MLRVVVRYKDDKVIEKIKKYGNIIHVSKLMKVIGIETTESGLMKIKKTPGVISAEKSAEGRLSPVIEAYV